MHMRKIVVLVFVEQSILCMSIRSSFWYQLNPLFCIYLLSRYYIHHWKWFIEVSYYYYTAGYFSLQFCLCLLHLFWGSVVRCICLSLLSSSWNNHFVNRKCSSYSFVTAFELNSVLFNTSMTTSVLFLFTICINHLFLSFQFQFICVFATKVNILYTSYSCIIKKFIL